MEATSLLLSILRAEIGDGSFALELTEAPSEEVLTSLYKLSKSQDLAHLVGDYFSKSKLTLPPAVAGAFSKQQLLAVWRCEQLRDASERLYTLFEDAKIPFVPLKGAVIRPYYPEAWMRTSCDIDILIHEEDLERASALIHDAFDATEEGERNYHDVSFYLNKNVHLELHFHIKENTPAMDAVLSRVWEHSHPMVEGGQRYLQSNEFLMLHLAAHNAYHFVNGGCGIRPFMDWWLLKRALSIDRDKLEALLSEAELLDFSRGMDALSEVWFSGETHTELTAEMEAYLLGAGIYGSRENSIVVAREKSGGRFRYVWGRIFMPYAKLKTVYPRLEHAPILYPFYVVFRWFHGIFRGRGAKAVRELKYSAAKPTEKTERTAWVCRQLRLIK